MGAIEMRDFVVDFLKQEVVGPSPAYPAIQRDGEEIIRESPKNRYGAGILFPKKSSQVTQAAAGGETDVEEVHEISDDDQDGLLTDEDKFAEAPDEIEQEVSLANEYLPSAMGLSTLLEVPEELLIEISSARYVRGPLSYFSPGRRNDDGTITAQPPRPGTAWYRRPLKTEARVNSAKLLTPDVKDFYEDLFVEGEKIPLRIHIVTRPFDKKQPKLRLVTITLVNENVCQGSSPNDEDCFFQTTFKVNGGSEMVPCFVPYPDQTLDEKDDESQSLFLLYRHRTVFAVGHGCAANWEDATEGRAFAIKTEAVPMHEIKPVRPTRIDNLDLSMNMLASGSNESIIKSCRQLAEAYGEWVETQRLNAKNDSSLSGPLSKRAEKHLDQCNFCCDRIERGINLLASNPLAMRAFKLMNEAMLMQQAHYKISSEKTRKWINDPSSDKPVLESPFEKPDYSRLQAAWYPFQLGFILMNISSIVEPGNSERDLVDVIWFPTGGGKTEAYLGLAAFVLFYRRLKGDFSASTAVLMRYTLRLLTTQQFQRASSLMCACEVLRKREEKALGKARFTIGLWVGGGVTPNKSADAVAALNELCRTGRDNKFITTSCPWCGCQLGPISIGNRKSVKGYIQAVKGKVQIRCEDRDCEFLSGLPVCVVDEELYDNPPTLLVGTVDKFALLPWEPRAGIFFGVAGTNELPPPDLIIQDELHLISGPLGSMVGLYEPLIDLLSSRNEIRPKIVASTATISRADEQIKALYGRKSALFPPQALVAGESFFAYEDEHAEGRRYVGVFGSAYSSHATSQVRTMSSLLQSAKMTDWPAEFVDPYWTLIGYFNSIRELGHAVTLVQGDISEYITVICERNGISWKFSDDKPAKPFPIRRIYHEEELTSRVNSTELPGKLNQLFTVYDGTSKTHAIDVCFATNMIQVGLDVPRLSLMAVVGQPKTTSEYIQASSRVGRSLTKPGLVVVNYNPSKPRDRSHYERFRQYHQSIYRHVEPTSVTPFAEPVRERALHALIIALVRLWGPVSINIAPTGVLDANLRKKVTDAILKRVKEAEPEEVDSTEEMIKRIFDRWLMLPAQRYGHFAPMDVEPFPLMYPAGSKTYLLWEQRSYETPSSMRSVDKDCEAAIISNVYPAPDSGN